MKRTKTGMVNGDIQFISDLNCYDRNHMDLHY